MKENKNGFTLLELLVVVVIIGILAGIALPQYRFAVEKSKITKYLPIAKAIREAQERHYMAHNEYALRLDSLDIDVHTLCKSTMVNMLFNCQDKSIKIDNLGGNNKATGILRILYCPGIGDETQTWQSCDAKPEMIINFHYAQAESEYKNQITCKSYTNRAQRLCKSFEKLGIKVL